MTTRKYVKIISATKSDTIQVQAKHAQELEQDINKFLTEKASSSVVDVKLLSVGTRDAWAMIIYNDETKKD